MSLSTHLPSESESTPGSCTRTLRLSPSFITALLILSGCSGVQSALDPAGRAADQIATLFYWLVGGAAIIWVAVVGLAFFALRAGPDSLLNRRASLLIIGGGTIVPTLVLAAYLTFGLSMLPDLLAPAPSGSLTIGVTGEQWWWRVRYMPAEETRPIEPFGRRTQPGPVPGRGDLPFRPEGVIELANEIRIPVGEPVQFLLDSPDVIHSFWIPSLGGKMDMIPGRTTTLTLEASRTGVFRGACAEYCGASHALMAFDVVVMERDDFDAWLRQQARPAEVTADHARGREVFFENGCAACHTIRGTPADGVVGPDLTHVGSRLSLGAGILPNERSRFFEWIAYTDDVKPDVHMPAFGMLDEPDLRALATFLDGLQ